VGSVVGMTLSPEVQEHARRVGAALARTVTEEQKARLRELLTPASHRLAHTRRTPRLPD